MKDYREQQIDDVFQRHNNNITWLLSLTVLCTLSQNIKQKQVDWVSQRLVIQKQLRQKAKILGILSGNWAIDFKYGDVLLNVSANQQASVKSQECMQTLPVDLIARRITNRTDPWMKLQFTFVLEEIEAEFTNMQSFEILNLLKQQTARDSACCSHSTPCVRNVSCHWNIHQTIQSNFSKLTFGYAEKYQVSTRYSPMLILPIVFSFVLSSCSRTYSASMSAQSTGVAQVNQIHKTTLPVCLRLWMSSGPGNRLMHGSSGPNS